MPRFERFFERMFDSVTSSQNVPRRRHRKYLLVSSYTCHIPTISQSQLDITVGNVQYCAIITEDLPESQRLNSFCSIVTSAFVPPKAAPVLVVRSGTDARSSFPG
jgi:hypothetical protein